MFSEMKKEIIEAGILLDRYELVSLTCGNLSVRMPTGEILVTPSGMMYEKMVEDDMIVMDIDGNVIEGTRKPSSDTPAILHIFRERPDINAVIDGALAGFIGVVSSVEPDKNKVNVTVSMFGRETPVELELDQVETLDE